ncbi:MAG TPA: YkgJ family cysteine cluster protein [Agitococcus sp.]|nr:YkgJ family cysteine cluster protein [Moraxellaceae bacterium]MBL0230482.1 YkgJ family cysteine cluster protein [Moraxellaceae bacterium]HQV80787.1 YkgJ family cysteine cluster protein [Agitococcus sp.]
MSACLSCGACCASFRVSFYWAETTEVMLEGVPQELTDAIAPFYNCMKGTNHKQPRCIALQGTVGETVSCSIYAQRSSTCREFDMLDEFGQINQACTQARAKYYLLPITQI